MAAAIENVGRRIVDLSRSAATRRSVAAERNRRPKRSAAAGDCGRCRSGQQAHRRATMKKKTRIDQALVELGFFESGERAQRAIMAGEVRAGDRVFAKPAEMIGADATISVSEAPKFASRGALKLSGALDHFGIDVRGNVALDI